MPLKSEKNHLQSLPALNFRTEAAKSLYWDEEPQKKKSTTFLTVSSPKGNSVFICRSALTWLYDCPNRGCDLLGMDSVNLFSIPNWFPKGLNGDWLDHFLNWSFLSYLLMVFIFHVYIGRLSCLGWDARISVICLCKLLASTNTVWWKLDAMVDFSERWTDERMKYITNDKNDNERRSPSSEGYSRLELKMTPHQ